ncbi:MAG TPA: ectoine/hydroxyectoine ABC transporter permease subunit EhuD [Stackebrandtia sp.]|jgi:polar amino acid transport system permease protein|uniref:ectoine/hydroxyectoine ABC transporter permease subunit EhuD n=1 Tax=Stackebrandtia sp. TaxID=2023065 RepID=UPI002D2F0504|nr:ectoine/hydroxyectoine ABC transporter permease subunit EhuD [Stackebrandtia sp.]HZE40281.1 ectoine/hydroxyectoine ABC transporter permease subunit EhuD [Stackebrandtia sp.]
MNGWDWNVAKELFPSLLKGFWVILEVTVLSSITCLLLGLVIAVVLRSAPKVVSAPLFAVVEFIRNTPLLVQLFFVWFGLAPLLGSTTPLVVGVIVLGIHYSTYTSEVYRAGIDAVPVGQWEAITALSLPKRYGWQHVILPQALRRVTPALGNYIISMFKEVPVLTAIGLAEMISNTQEYVATFNTGYLEGYTIAGLIFLAVSYPTAVAMRKLEKRLAKQ